MSGASANIQTPMAEGNIDNIKEKFNDSIASFFQIIPMSNRQSVST